MEERHWRRNSKIEEWLTSVGGTDDTCFWGTHLFLACKAKGCPHLSYDFASMTYFWDYSKTKITCLYHVKDYCKLLSLQGSRSQNLFICILW